MLSTALGRALLGGSGARVAWFDPAWSARRRITVDTSAQGSALRQYQVKITLTASTFDFTKPISSGADFRVTAADGVTLLPYYVLAYDSVAHTGTIWVRVPLLPAGGTTTLYLYYGNPSPATFTLPPTGMFTRPTTSVAAGLAENMVFDPVSAKYYICYADNPVGNLWVRSSTSPAGPWAGATQILTAGAGGQFDAGGLYAPHLLLSGGTWYLFYSGAPDASGNGDAIGVATASIITGPYTRSGSNPLLSPSGVGGSWDQYRACECYVSFSSILNTWTMLYMGDSGSGTGSSIEQVGFATAAAPGGPWTKAASNPILAFPSPAPTWDSGTIADPFVVELGGVAYVFYTGATGTSGSSSNWTIGFATTTDYATFTRGWQVYGRGGTGEFDHTASFRGAVLLVGTTWYLPYATGANTWAVASMSAVSTAAGFDPWQVFDYYDAFAGAAVDAARWGPRTDAAEGGTTVVSGGQLTLTTTTGKVKTLVGRREFGVGHVAEFVVRSNNADGGGNHAGEVGLSLDERTDDVRLFDNNNAKWLMGSVKTNTATNTAMTETLDGAFHTRRIAFVSSSSVLYQIDNGAWQQLTTNVPAISLPPWLFAFANTGVTTSMDVTSVIVRKYAAVEPTVIVGAEA